MPSKPMDIIEPQEYPGSYCSLNGLIYATAMIKQQYMRLHQSNINIFQLHND